MLCENITQYTNQYTTLFYIIAGLSVWTPAASYMKVQISSRNGMM